MSTTINILAVACFFDPSGVPLYAGTLTATPSSSFSVPGEQVLGSTLERKIVNGSMVGSLKLYDPSQTSPQGIGYTFTISDGKGYSLTYPNVLISPDGNGNYDLSLLNAGLFVPAVPKTVISFVGSSSGTGTGNDTFLTFSAATAISAYVGVAAVSGQAIATNSSDLANMGALVGVSTQGVQQGAPLIVQFAGQLTYNGWNFAKGPIYLGPNGTLTQTPPSSGFLQVVGVQISPTSILLDPQLPILIQ